MALRVLLMSQEASLLGEVGGIGDALIDSVIRSATGFHNIAVVWYTISKIFYGSNLKEVQPHDNQNCYR